MNLGRQVQLVFSVLVTSTCLHGQSEQASTYCNPLNIDYAYGAIPNFVEKRNHRTTADPVITLFKGNYYLFSTNQYGYWWSSDLSVWKFLPRRFLKPFHKVYDELCAPAVLAAGDTLLVIGSTYTKDFPLWMSTNPTTDSWKEAVDSFQVGAWDPALFLDDDGRLYIYFGSSNKYPIYGQEIDRQTLLPVGDRKELLALHDDVYGWERFGEYADNTFLRPFIEGAWMNKYNGKYYLQYGAPGTQFSGYADGVYVGSHPLGPFEYQAHNPFSYKPGGFARGAGHGATFQDKFGNWWHVATIAVSVKNDFERRIGLWPSGFDREGVLYCNTVYGDYPHYLPDTKADHLKSRFTGWMLLNYNKPVMVSSTYGGYAANYAVDEDIKTYWSAASGAKGEWLQSDLGSVSVVNAIQVNYADQNAELMGKHLNIYHRYVVKSSLDSKKWNTLIDKSRNMADVPHDYVELKRPTQARFIRIENVHVATGKFALSGLRVFGKGNGAVPDTVRNFVVLRGESERRNAWLKWKQSDDAVGYTIYIGLSPDKLYNNIMVYGANERYFPGMDRNRAYYFQIEAFNEKGLGPRSQVVKAE
ncbi:MAG: family 43 glycosylhydrolase [Ignavibacteriales bacterium]|nr:family 43 glycosylhydrolase [Ignavibacteriales bacterium]